MSYLSLAILPIAADQVEAYRAIAEQMSAIWLKHGAHSYRDFVGDDLDVAGQGAVPFPQIVKLNEGETLIVATMTFDSRDHRDDVQARVMEDPQVAELMGEGTPFDHGRMVYGGFDVLVGA